MTPDDVRHELRAARPLADAALQARVRAIATAEQERRPSPFTRLAGRRRELLIALPVAATLAVATAGAIGLARSGDAERSASPPGVNDYSGPVPTDQKQSLTTPPAWGSAGSAASTPGGSTLAPAPSAQTVAPRTDRAQRYAATLTLEVAGTNELSEATQRALRIARDLDGFALDVSYASAESGTASMTLRIPTGRVQDAIARLSQLGTIVDQQVQVDDLQEGLDELESRIRNLRARIATLTARLEGSPDAETRATLESRRTTARAELTELTRSRTATRREASLATVQLALRTDDEGLVPAAPSRLDRALDQAVEVLAWQGVALLFLGIVAGPLVALGLAAWLAARVLRRRGDARLLGA